VAYRTGMDERQGVFCVGTLETSCFAFWDQVASLLGIVSVFRCRLMPQRSLNAVHFYPVALPCNHRLKA